MDSFIVPLSSPEATDAGRFGPKAANQAALVKDLGTRFEQESVDLAADLMDYVAPEDNLRLLLAAARLHSPMFTLRGGTNEVLRGVIARGMGLR